MKPIDTPQQHLRASSIKLGDIIIHEDSRFNYIVEDITEPTTNEIRLHYNNMTASSLYDGHEMLTVIRLS